MAIPFQSEEQTHRQFLKMQKEMEKAVDELHKRTEQTMNKIIARNTNLQGTVDRHKIKKLVDVYMTKELRRYRKELSAQIKSGVGTSSHLGIKSILAAVAPHRKITSLVWKKLNKRIRKQVISLRGVDGLTLSERVWKLSGDATHQLKKVISSGILNGEPAAKISRDVRGYLLQPKTLRGRVKDLLRPGTGTYKSAYKNAMRVIRTETANAYLYGQSNTAAKMGYNLQWQLSVAHAPTGCQCESYHGNIYTPADLPNRPHPHCMCFTLTVPA